MPEARYSIPGAFSGFVRVWDGFFVFYFNEYPAACSGVRSLTFM